jgi:hypothetical protein
VPSEIAFLVATGITFLISGLVVLFLWRTLQAVLLDLSCSEKRVPFWLHFWAVILLLLPLTVLLLGRAGFRNHGAVFFQVTDLLGLGMAGLIAALLLIGVGVGILLQSRWATLNVSPEQATDLERLLSKVEEIRAHNVLSRQAEKERFRA